MEADAERFRVETQLEGHSRTADEVRKRSWEFETPRDMG